MRKKIVIQKKKYIIYKESVKNVQFKNRNNIQLNFKKLKINKYIRISEFVYL